MSQPNDPYEHPQYAQYPGPKGRSWVRRHRFLTSLIVFGALAGVGGILQATGQGKPQAAPAPTVTITATARAKATAKASAAAAVKASAKNPSLTVEPTFAYPGNSQCTIIYRRHGNGTMTWTATVTIAGELITHASDSAGSIYRHDVQVSPGSTVFTAPVSLLKIDDIGGVLYAGNASYGCSIAPQKASSAPGPTLRGFGATLAQWEASHTLDLSVPARNAYLPQVADSGGEDTWQIVTVADSRITSYTLNVVPSSLKSAEERARQELPADAWVLWKHTFGDTCAQEQFWSATLAAALGDGQVNVEYDNAVASAVTPVTEELFSTSDALTAAQAPHC